MVSQWRYINLDKYRETIINIVTGEKTHIERELTSEEIAAMEEAEANQPVPEPTTEDRLSALESALLEMITGGENGG